MIHDTEVIDAPVVLALAVAAILRRKGGEGMIERESWAVLRGAVLRG